MNAPGGADKLNIARYVNLSAPLGVLYDRQHPKY